MRSYRTLPDAGYQTHRRIQIFTAAATRPEGVTIEQIAEQEGCSEELIYKLERIARVAFAPRKPGPKHRPLPQLKPNVIARQLTPAPLDPRELSITLATEHVSVRGMQRVFRAAGAEAPSRETLLHHIHTAGRAARRLLERARRQVREGIRCLAADDIFLHRVPVKVVLEPVSGAVMEVWRWAGSHTGEDWELFLHKGEWPSLRLLVSDLGSDLVRAASKLLPGVWQQADMFHERQWWNEKVFAPLSRREQRLASAAAACLDAYTHPKRRGPAVSAATVAETEALRAAAEEDFFAAVRAEQGLLPLFESLTPLGRLWSAELVEAALEHDVIPWVVRLPDELGEKVAEHVYQYRDLWCAHRVMWDLIAVDLVAESGATATAVIELMLSVLAAEEDHAQATQWTVARASELLAAQLRAKLSTMCRNVASVEASVRSLRDAPRRSSSLVEAFNAVIRGAQQVHRTVSDDLLALYALRWNLTPRTEGSRCGPSPFARLGVDFADDGRPWIEVLIEEMDRA